MRVLVGFSLKVTGSAFDGTSAARLLDRLDFARGMPVFNLPDGVTADDRMRSSSTTATCRRSQRCASPRSGAALPSAFGSGSPRSRTSRIADQLRPRAPGGRPMKMSGTRRVRCPLDDPRWVDPSPATRRAPRTGLPARASSWLRCSDRPGRPSARIPGAATSATARLSPGAR
jgi:hypothetical protein